MKKVLSDFLEILEMNSAAIFAVMGITTIYMIMMYGIYEWNLFSNETVMEETTERTLELDMKQREFSDFLKEYGNLDIRDGCAVFQNELYCVDLEFMEEK